MIFFDKPQARMELPPPPPPLPFFEPELAAEKKLNILSKLLTNSQRFPQELHSSILNPADMPESNTIDTIYNLIRAAREHLLELDLTEAKHDYLEIIRIYNSLSLDAQKTVYEEIKELYQERKGAESLQSNF